MGKRQTGDRSLFEHLAEIERRYAELERLTQDPEVLADPRTYTAYLREMGGIEKLARARREYQELARREEEAKALQAEAEDPEMKELAREEMTELASRVEALGERVLALLVSEEPDSHRNGIMEIRAGTGGDEATLFAADLFRMYSRLAERRGFEIEVLHSSESEVGGFKEIIFAVKGEGAYKLLRFESGGHRVQRIPQTESQGRIHTSAATVAVLPEVEEIEVEIRPDDLRIDTFSASGPGGQHVNKTQSAVRIVHEPTGIVVSCQDEKSQHKNKARAMRILRGRLYRYHQERQLSERAARRRTLIGSGDRSERIRTYNFPQNRVTDHRIGESFHDLDAILDGRLDSLLERLDSFDREERLKDLSIG